MDRRNQISNKIGEKWGKNIGEIWKDKYKLQRTAKRENLGIHLSFEVIGSEDGLWEGGQRERRLIAMELFWWLIGRKYGESGRKGRGDGLGLQT
jgi:hypothetical protein